MFRKFKGLSSSRLEEIKKHCPNTKMAKIMEDSIKNGEEVVIISDEEANQLITKGNLTRLSNNYRFVDLLEDKYVVPKEIRTNAGQVKAISLDHVQQTNFTFKPAHSEGK